MRTKTTKLLAKFREEIDFFLNGYAPLEREECRQAKIQ
jgi:hypothetical protein